ncbi:MAG: PqqD family protein [Gemmatimonadaceae bacterium]
MDQTSAATQYRRTDGYVYRLTVGEHLLVSLHNQTVEPFYALTPTGALLWEALANWATVDDLGKALTKEYDVTTEQARTDAKEFIEQLGLLSAVESRSV